MQVLDSYEVQIFPGDKYANTHLFVRATYVHKILFTNDQVMLADAPLFDGPRTTFTPDEMAALRELFTEIQAAERDRLSAKQSSRSTQARHSIARTNTKLAGMESTQIFD